MKMKYVCLSFSLLLSGCFNMPILSKGQVSPLNTQPRLAETTEVAAGKSVSAFDPKSTVATTIAAPSGALAGSSITFPPGSLGISVNLVVEQAVGLSQTSLTSSLGISSSVAITPVGAGLIIRPSENVDLTKPLTIAMPLDPAAGLRSWFHSPWKLFAQKYYAVFYKSFIDGELKAGVIPTNALRLSDDGKALFEGYFGAYWLVEVSSPIEEKIEVKTDEPIVNKDNVSVIESTGIVTEEAVNAKASIPTVQWLAVMMSFDAATRSVSLSASIAEGRSLNNCRVDFFEDPNNTTGINVTTDSKLLAIYVVQKTSAHRLYGRFRCLDDQGRQSISEWSAAISIAAVIVNLAPAISAGPANWIVYTGQVIEPVDFYDSFTGKDSDRDGDGLVYSCVYDNSIDGVVTSSNSCGSIQNADQTLAAFSSSKGTFYDWIPAGAAAGLDFEFKVTASDSRGATSSAIFSTKVKDGSPLLGTVSNRIFPNSYLMTTNTLALNFDNLRSGAGSDTNMNYSCTYKTLMATDSSATNCALLPGTFSFDSTLGEMSWLPGNSGAGAYELSIVGSNAVGSNTRSFKVDVLPGIDTNARLFHLDARFADKVRGGVNSSTSTTSWYDLTANGSLGTLYNFNAASAWSGSATSSSSDPMALNFDGVNDYVNFPDTNFIAKSALHFDAWVYQGSNGSEKVIFSNSDVSGHGLMLSDRKFLVGSGGSGSFYESSVLLDAPQFYWRFSTISGGTTPDSSGNGISGILQNASNVYADTNDISALGPAIKTLSNGYLSPSTTINLGSNWTMEAWFRYPFPDGCSTSWCTLARGNGDHQIIVQQSSMQLGTYIGGFFSSGFNMQTLSTGWHHLATVGSGGTTKFYIDGAQVGSTVNVQSTEQLVYVGGLGTQPFGQIDEFAFYGSALSASRIAAHYASASGISCAYTMNPGTWNHLAGTADDSSQTGKFYVNGSQVCSFAIPAGQTVAGSSTSLMLGRSSAGASTSWQGKIASLIFYDNANDSNIVSNFTAGSTGFSSMPSNGLQLWLRADKGLFQNASRTVPASAQDQPVFAWVDQSGSGGDMIVNSNLDQVTARPILKTNALNGKPVLSFDGADNLQNVISYSYPNTLFIVARYTGSTLRERILTGTTGNWLFGWWQGSADAWYPEYWIGNMSPADTNWRMYGADQDAGNQRFYRSNQLIGSSNNSYVQAPQGLTLGSWGGFGEWSACEVAEVIYYNRVLSDSERASVFMYLSQRYGL